jgi:hypothetical protein
VAERQKGMEDFRLVDTFKPGNFSGQDPHEKMGLEVRKVTYGNLSFVHVDALDFSIYESQVPSFSMVERMYFRPWVTDNPSKRNRFWTADANQYTWSGYMLLDDKGMAYYLMEETLESGSHPASHLVLVFDKECNLVAMQAPGEGLFTPINYNPLIELDSVEKISFRNGPMSSLRIQRLMHAYPDANVHMSLNHLSYQFFDKKTSDADPFRTRARITARIRTMAGIRARIGSLS